MFLRKIYGAMVALVLCIGLVPACGSDQRTSALPNPTDDPEKFDPDLPPVNPGAGEMSICIPALHPTGCRGETNVIASAAVIAPAPGTVIICNSIATRIYSPESCLDVSSQVVGGIWTPSQQVPIGGWENINIFVNNVPRMSGIQINGVTVTTFCPVAAGNYDYEVASVMFGRDMDGTIIVYLNPVCTDTISTSRIVASGDSAQAVFDEYEVTLGGTLTNTIQTRLQSSLLRNPTLVPPADNVLVTPMTFDATLNAFVAYFEVGSTQEAYFRVLRTDPNPQAPPGSFKPIHATYFQVMNGVSVTCSSEMVFYTDLNATVGQVDPAHRITGVNPLGTCATQGVENRSTVPDFTG